MARRLTEISMALALALAIGACGGDGDTTAGSGDSTAAGESAAAPVDEGTVIETDDADDQASAPDGAETDEQAEAPVGVVPTAPWDPATIGSVGFEPALECPILSYGEANAARPRNLQPLEVTESSCFFDNGTILDGEIFVAVGAPGTFDPADTSFVSEFEPIIAVESVGGPGTNARMMSLDFAGEAQFYGMVFEVDGSEVLVTADRMGLDADQLGALATAVAARVPGATFVPGVTDVETTGPGFCSLFDAAGIQALLGTTPSSASWSRSDIAGCNWDGGFAPVASVSQPLGGSVDPNSTDPDIVISDLGVPAARDPFADWIINLEIAGVHVVVSTESYDNSLIIARNLIDRAES